MTRKSGKTNTKRNTALTVQVGSVIHKIRGQRVILDSDLARIYGVETKILNKAVNRNRRRFPEDFGFRLTAEAFSALRFQIGTSKKGRGGRRYPPMAFTEHGAIMVATVLNSPTAVDMSVFVVRAFVRMREELASRRDMEKRLKQIEKILLVHDNQLRELLDEIRPLLLPPPEEQKKQIGFSVREKRARYGTLTRKSRPAAEKRPNRRS
jgi:phage regulator Rha-like protein